MPSNVPPPVPSHVPSCSIYIRCKNSVQEALYSQMMAIYFKASFFLILKRKGKEKSTISTIVK